MAGAELSGFAHPVWVCWRVMWSNCEGMESSGGFLSWECPVCPQKTALAQLPELTSAQPELSLAGDQPAVIGPAQPAPEVLPAPAHGHHGEVLRAPQAGLDMVSWGKGDQDGAHGLQLVLCPQPGQLQGVEGEKLNQGLSALASVSQS